MGEVKQLIGSSALTFVKGLVDARENGRELPPLLTKIADAAISGKESAKGLAIEAAKEETKKQFPWILVIVLSLVVIIMVYIALKKR